MKTNTLFCCSRICTAQECYTKELMGAVFTVGDAAALSQRLSSFPHSPVDASGQEHLIKSPLILSLYRVKEQFHSHANGNYHSNPGDLNNPFGLHMFFECVTTLLIQLTCLPCFSPVGVLLELRGVGPRSPPLPSRPSLAPGKLLEGIWN